jgi:D-glycero-D-manno-heptose 1,7-bisphosphate phosphatase
MSRLEMSVASRPLLLLDRGGTIMVEKGFPKEPAEVELIAGSAAAIRRLRTLGLKAAVISNQSGIGRGYLTHEDVARVNAPLAEFLAAEGAALDGLYYCPYAFASRASRFAVSAGVN